MTNATASVDDRLALREREILDAATRREFLAMLAAAGLLAACGDDTDVSNGSGQTRTVQTSHGPVQVPVAPQRVVAMHDQLVAYAIASLGFDRLIAVAGRDEFDATAAITEFGDPPAGFDGLSPIGTYSEPDVEAIALLEPDLIIGLPDEVDPYYDRLSAIAPTVVIALADGPRAPFQRQRDLAAVVGVDDELDERLADYQTRVEVLRAKLGGGLDGAAYTYIESFGTGAEDNWIIRSDHAPGLMVLRDLGVAPSSTTTALDEEYNPVSLERVGQFDADLIFLGIPVNGEIDPRLTDLLEFTTAGKAGQVFVVSRDVWALEVAEALHASLDNLDMLLSNRDLSISGQFS